MAIHINDISVESFRGIRGLKLSGFNHVNILLGNNNTGKTSLLELLESTQAPTSLSNWKNVIRTDQQSASPLYDGFLGLFPMDSEMRIGYSFTHKIGTTEVDINGETEITQVSEREIQRLNGFIPTGNTKDKSLDQPKDAKRLLLKFFRDKIHIAEYSVYDFLRRSPQESGSEEFYPTVRVQPMLHDYNGHYLNEALKKAQLYQNLISVLKIFDASINGIQAIQDPYGINYRLITTRYRDSVPLNLYGDGLKKAIELICAVVTAENGILLIDEYETSIHPSAMQKTYEWILKTAKILNVQLFMTTHSKEALALTLGIGDYDSNDISIHTLFKEDDGIVTRSLGATEALHAMNNWGMDLR